MKKIILFGAFVVLCQSGFSQTLAEWTRQKKTQIKYLRKQVAALQVYIGHLKKGYDIAGKGLQLIGSIKEGDFNLHRDFFGALKSVNPRIIQYSKLAQIFLCSERVSQYQTKSIQLMERSEKFLPSEVQQAQSIMERLQKEANILAEEALVLVRSGQYELRDDERIDRIDAIHEEIYSIEKMIRQYGQGNLVLAVQRIKEENDATVMKKLYGLPK